MPRTPQSEPRPSRGSRFQSQQPSTLPRASRPANEGPDTSEPSAALQFLRRHFQFGDDGDDPVEERPDPAQGQREQAQTTALDAEGPYPEATPEEIAQFREFEAKLVELDRKKAALDQMKAEIEMLKALQQQAEMQALAEAQAQAQAAQALQAAEVESETHAQDENAAEDEGEEDSERLLAQLQEFQALRSEVESLTTLFNQLEATNTEEGQAGVEVPQQADSAAAELQAMMAILGSLPGQDQPQQAQPPSQDSMVQRQPSMDDMQAYAETQAYITRQESELQRLLQQQEKLRAERERLRALQEEQTQPHQESQQGDGELSMSQAMEMLAMLQQQEQQSNVARVPQRTRNSLQDALSTLQDQHGELNRLASGGDPNSGLAQLELAMDDDLDEDALQELQEELARHQALQKKLLEKQEELRQLQTSTQMLREQAGYDVSMSTMSIGDDDDAREEDTDDADDAWQESLYGDDRETADMLQQVLQSMRLKDRVGQLRGEDASSAAAHKLSVNGELLPGQISPRSVSAVSVAAVEDESTYQGGEVTYVGDSQDGQRDSILKELAAAQDRMKILRSMLMVNEADFGENNYDEYEGIQAGQARQFDDHILDDTVDEEDDQADRQRAGQGQEDLEAAALRGKIDLQNMQLAVTYAETLGPEERDMFYDLFFDAFEDQTATQAFRQAVYQVRQYKQSPAVHPAASPASRFRDAPEAYQRASMVSMPSAYPEFDLYKENIYREVAVFISANEDRPLFLLQLFRQLQELNSDDSRSRLLKTLQHQTLSAPQNEETRQSSNRVSARGNTTPSYSLAQRVSFPYDYAEPVEEAGSSIVTSEVYSTATDDDIFFATDPLEETIVRRSGVHPSDAPIDKLIDSIDTSFHQRHGRSYRYMDEDGLLTSSVASESDATVDRELVMREFEAEVQSNKEIVTKVTNYLDSLQPGALIDDKVVGTVSQMVVNAASSWLPPNEAGVGGEDPAIQLMNNLRQCLLKYLGTQVQERGGDAIADVSNLLYDEMVFNKVVREVDRSYQEEISVLRQTQSSLEVEEDILRQQRDQDLNQLQRDRWQRYRRSLGSLMNDESDVDDARDDAMATPCDVPDDTDGDSVSIGLIELQLTPAEVGEQSGASTPINDAPPTGLNGELSIDDLPKELNIDSDTLKRMEAQYNAEQESNEKTSALAAAMTQPADESLAKDDEELKPPQPASATATPATEPATSAPADQVEKVEKAEKVEKPVKTTPEKKKFTSGV